MPTPEQIAYERLCFHPWIPYHGQPGEMGGLYAVRALLYWGTKDALHFKVKVILVKDLYRGTRCLRPPTGFEYILAWQRHRKGEEYRKYDPDVAWELWENAHENPVGKDRLK